MAEMSKVVVPVDFTSKTDKVVHYALSIADKLGAQVLFFHVVSDFQGYDMMLVHPSFITMKQDLEKQARKRLDALLAEYRERKGGVGGDIAVGDAAEEIVRYAEAEKADMIIIGTHGTKGLEKILLGSTAERVVKKAPCPVLVFNPFK